MTLLVLDWALVLEKFIFIVIVIMVCFLVALYSTYGERKVAAWIQDRHGPNRAGPFGGMGGILQPLSDGAKMFFKEEIIPSSADKKLYILGPIIAMTTSLLTSAVIPWGDHLVIGNKVIELQIADINVGMLYIFAVVSVGVYGMMIGGWASNNKYSLLAALRGASQTISYELALGMSLIALLMVTGSLSLRTIVDQQIETGVWNIVYQPLGFLLFWICMFAECNRTPFDLAEAESELNQGFHQEYSSMTFGFYMFYEYVNMFAVGAIMSTLFLGGYDVPFLDESTLHPNWAAVIGIISIMIKSLFFVFVFMWVRWTVPRFRYDQLMNLGWKGLLPLTIANMILTAVFLLLFNK